MANGGGENVGKAIVGWGGEGKKLTRQKKKKIIGTRGREKLALGGEG